MSTYAEINKMVDELYHFLWETLDFQRVTRETIEEFRANRINGESLTDAELAEVVPILGERKAKKDKCMVYYSEKDDHQTLLNSQAVNMTDQDATTEMAGAGELGNTYKLPNKFSKRVMEATCEGIITEAIRSEIITIIALGMWQITTQPTSDEYSSIYICRLALVQQYPVLKDTNGSGYGSWKLQLRQKFKNMRRPIRPQKRLNDDADKKDEENQLDTITLTPPAKKKRKHVDCEEYSCDDANDETQDVDCLVADIETPKKCVRQIMKSTFKIRRNWIMKECPPVSELLIKYPCLRNHKFLLRELSTITDKFSKETAEENILKLLPKIRTLATKEGNTRKTISSILKNQEIEIETYDEDERTELQQMHAFELLPALLQLRGKMNILQCFNGNESVEFQSNNLAVNAPHIVAVSGSSSLQFLIICERLGLVETSSFLTAVCCLISAYFTLNKDYPTNVLLGIEDEEPFPNSACCPPVKEHAPWTNCKTIILIDNVSIF